MGYLLSIVIPTKDRYFYLKHLINLIDSFKCNEIEVVLQDNTTDNKEILEFLQEREYNYIKYYHEPKSISISLNCDMAILNSTGEYVCFIGDDDGVTKYIIDVVHWLKNNNENILLTSNASYYWPDYYESITGNLAGSISCSEYTWKIKTISTIESLNKLFKYGCTNRDVLPLTYHGIVKRAVLDIIYKKGKTFFPGPSPDMANGVALCLTVSEYIVLDAPIIISGASKNQGGGARSMKNQASDLSTLPFLPKNTVDMWESRIPKIWTAETIWAESAIKALRYMDRNDLIQNIDFQYLYSKFIVFHFPLRYLLAGLKYNVAKVYIHSLWMMICRYYRAGIRRIKRFLFNSSDGVKYIYGLNNINEAINKFTELFPKRKY